LPFGIGDATLQADEPSNIAVLNIGRHNALLIVLAILLASLVVLLFSGRARLSDLRHEKAQIDQRIASLQDDNRRLRDEMDRLRGDTPAHLDHLEQVIRDEMGFVRDGEVVFVFGTEAERGK
jgi:cell division protein FtsB